VTDPAISAAALAGCGRRRDGRACGEWRRARAGAGPVTERPGQGSPRCELCRHGAHFQHRSDLTGQWPARAVPFGRMATIPNRAGDPGRAVPYFEMAEVSNRGGTPARFLIHPYGGLRTARRSDRSRSCWKWNLPPVPGVSWRPQPAGAATRRTGRNSDGRSGLERSGRFEVFRASGDFARSLTVLRKLSITDVNLEIRCQDFATHAGNTNERSRRSSGSQP
jgi:hypothetical protein